MSKQSQREKRERDAELLLEREANRKPELPYGTAIRYKEREPLTEADKEALKPLWDNLRKQLGVTAKAKSFGSAREPGDD